MQKKISIGIVLPSVPVYSETFIWSKIKGLLESGYLVSLFINNRTQSDLLKVNIPVYTQPKIKKPVLLIVILFAKIIKHPISLYNFIKEEIKSKRNSFYILKNIIINSHILGKKIDWIHFEYTTMSIGRENIGKAMGIKSSVSFRGYDIGLYPYDNPGCYDLLWEKIDKIHTISDDLYNKAIILGLDSNIPVQKITPAIDTSFFIYKQKIKINNPIRILSIGRLAWKKGFEYALKGLASLKLKNINFEYHIVGEGNYRDAILYAIEELDLSESVTLKGRLSVNKVRDEMDWADLYIQPSIQEGFCNAVLEAQAMGLLCIVTDAEGLSENVLDGKTGWVIPKRSPEAITEQIIKIINMEMLQYNKIRENAIIRVKNHFHLNEQIQNWSDFYKFD